MIFGYLGAVIAGFVLTAVPNWTGRLPLSGKPLALLFAAWLAGRIAMFMVSAPLWALPPRQDLHGCACRRRVAGGDCGKELAQCAGGSADHALRGRQCTPYAGNLWPAVEGTGVRLALGVAAMMIALIGGRITPSFTRNWLAKRKPAELPTSFCRLDRFALATTALGLAGGVVLPESAATGVLLLLSGLLLGGRLSR